MTAVLVEVGPETVRGPNHPEPERVTAALECIDDDIGWVDNHPIAAPALWRDVMYEAVGEGVDSLVVVCPTWWPSTWIAVVHDAAHTVVPTVAVLTRSALLREEAHVTVVEIAADLVVVASSADVVDALPRYGDVEVEAAAVAGRIAVRAAVLVDIPDGVAGGLSLCDAVAKRLRAKGVDVTVANREHVRRAVARLARDEEQDPVESRPTHFSRRSIAAVAGGLLSIAVLAGGFAVHGDTAGPTADDMPMTLLVEGRVGVNVPAQWTVQRITSGPGSARVQVVSPSDADVIVHITQSRLAAPQTREAVAESLRNALGEEPAGVFVDFDPVAQYADKPAVTYREIRQDRHIAWTVLVDKALRIAIGCQSAPGREQLVRDACDRAIGSAHAVF